MSTVLDRADARASTRRASAFSVDTSLDWRDQADDVEDWIAARGIRIEEVDRRAFRSLCRHRDVELLCAVVDLICRDRPRKGSRRRQGAGTINEQRPGYWLVRVRNGVDPVTGRAVVLRRAGRGSRQDAEQWLLELTHECSTIPRNPTAVEWERRNA